MQPVSDLLGSAKISQTFYYNLRSYLTKRDTKLRYFMFALEVGLDLIITNQAEEAGQQANRAAIVLIELITASNVIDALHASITSGDSLVKDSINLACTDALLPQVTDITHPLSRRGLPFDYSQDMRFARNDRSVGVESFACYLCDMKESPISCTV
jgi:guanyl-specific ribonuclease Sa